MSAHDCICANCALTFELPAVAVCPYCKSRQVRRVDPNNHVEVLRALIQDAVDIGDTEAVECLQRVLDRTVPKPRQSSADVLFDLGVALMRAQCRTLAQPEQRA